MHLDNSAFVSVRRALLSSGAIVSIAAASFSCDASSDDADGETKPDTRDCTAEEIAGCLVNQHACAATTAAATCSPCARGEVASAEGKCTAIAGDRLDHAFTEFTTAAGEEVKGLCQSWTLENDQELWVNTVELVQNEQSHHSNWTFVPEDRYPGADGVWRCSERNYDQLSAAVAGGVLYAQSTQATREVQKFPDGAAVRIPPRSKIIGDVHLLNVTSAPATGHLELSLYTLAPDAVTVKLAPFHLTYQALDIPAQSTSRFTGTCDLTNASAMSPSIKLYYALPHTHALGSRFFLKALGSAHDGEMLLDVRGFNGEARGRNYTPPVDLSGLTGFEFGCEFENPRAERVGWGFGDQEMCEMLGFIESKVAFESSVDENAALGTEGNVALFGEACSTIVIPWDK